ncbi:MAG: ATP-dependent DNA helicase RecG [Chloroflexota bacterium]
MAISAFDRLSRVLDLEEKQGWRNRGVVGGIKAMCTRWENDARTQEADEQILTICLSLMVEYDGGTKQTRPIIARQIRQVLSGDLTGFDSLPTKTDEEPEPSQEESGDVELIPVSPAPVSPAPVSPAPVSPAPVAPEPQVVSATSAVEPVAEEPVDTATFDLEAELESTILEILGEVSGDAPKEDDLSPTPSLDATPAQAVPSDAVQAVDATAGETTDDGDGSEEENFFEKELTDLIGSIAFGGSEPVDTDSEPEPAHSPPTPPDRSQSHTERHPISPIDRPIDPPEPTHIARERVRRQKSEQQNAAQQYAAQQTVSHTPNQLQQPPTILPGIGPTRAEQLERLGIKQIVDILWHLPRYHDDFTTMRTIAELQPGEQVTIIANIWQIRERRTRNNRSMVQGVLSDGTGTIHATWWNKWVKNKLIPETTMRFSGKVGLYMGQKTLDNAQFEELDEERIAAGHLSAIYPLTEGITNHWMRNLIKNVCESHLRFISDPLPRTIREEYELPDLATALYQNHFPDNHEALDAAKRRIAFEEFFYIQLGALQRRSMLQQGSANQLKETQPALEQFKTSLPFTLTSAQDRVLDEVARDMERSVPMTRLVQGDVGSGKTAVAAGAMWMAAVNGLQSALLAPTQILAEQHHRGLMELMGGLTKPDGSPLQIELLTGRVTGRERERILMNLNRDPSLMADNPLFDGFRQNPTDIVVGTTALIQETVEFNNLGFVVVDEQHRFGVGQRGALRSKGELFQPHMLVMSATPIPRSLALTVYGELDISIIDEKPAGRKPIKTKRFDPAERERLYGFMRREAREGRQAFIIYPLVEESEKMTAGAAIEAHTKLSNEIFPDLRIALLHGRMTGKEKDEIMQAFADREYHVLVSTSVIEVGIDVPNASLIMIEDAERFGLAQLHQFRGRVGRGSHQSYCALVSKAEGYDAQERIQALADTNDGFVLAEKDLELRGPGDFLGTRQSGLPELRMAHLSDLDTLSTAREAAKKLYDQDPHLDNHPQLYRQVRRFWQGHGDVN